MQSFKDISGDSWAVEVTFYDVREVARECDGFSLSSLFDDKLEGLGRLYDDHELLVSVLYCLCKSKIAERGLSPEDFARRFGGDSLLDAANAVVEATIDFFPDQRRREAIRRFLATLKKTDDTMREKVAPAALDNLERKLAEMTQSELTNLLTGSSGNAAESSASSPGDSRSAS